MQTAAQTVEQGPAGQSELHDRWVAALNAHDVEAVLDCYTEDAVFTDVGSGQVARGADELREMLERFFATFADLRVEPGGGLTEGDRFAHEFTMSGVHAGSLPGLPATGRSFTLPGLVIGQVRDGRLSQVTEYWNMADLLTQVGVLPAR